MAAIYPADTFQEGVDLTIEASNQLAQVVRGDANTEVMVADGSTIPSIRKAQADSMYFKEPELWTKGQTETDYLQLKKYIDSITNKESWWFAKGATVFNPVAMGTSPFGDDNWTLYTPEDLFISGKAEYESVYQALKGKAAEAGYNLVRGSFEEGGTLTNTKDVLWYQATGKYYNWYDGSAKTVAAGATPATSGGIGAGAWVDRTDVTLRSDLASESGSGLVGYQPAGTGAVATTVQSKLGETVSVKDFGAVGDGVTDDTAAIQAAIDYAMYQSPVKIDTVKMPAGTYIISRTIHLGYGDTFKSVRLEGDGAKIPEDKFGGTVVIAQHSDSPAFNIQGGRVPMISKMGIIGQGYDYYKSNNIGGLGWYAPDKWDESKYEVPGLDSRAYSQTAPYAGICIDGYSGSRPEVSYPDVDYPDFISNQDQYGKSFTNKPKFRDLIVSGFAVGVVTQPSGTADGNGDFLSLKDCTVNFCKYCVSIGNTQSRLVRISNSFLENSWVALTNQAHGTLRGKFGGLVDNTCFDRTTTVLTIEGGITGAVTLENCYGELIGRIGSWAGSTSTNTIAHPLNIIGGQYNFAEADNERFGFPSSHIRSNDYASVNVVGAAFSHTTSLRLSGKVSMIGVLSIIKDQDHDGIIGRLLAGCGGVITPSKLTNFGDINFTSRRYNPNTGLRATGVRYHGEITKTKDCVRDKLLPMCSSIVTTESAIGSMRNIYTSQVAIISVDSIIDELTYTANVSDAESRIINTGDVVHGAYGDGKFGYVSSVIGTTITIKKLGGYYKNQSGDSVVMNNDSVDVEPGNTMYIMSNNRYTPTYHITGDITSGSNVITNCGRGDGFFGDAKSILQIGDSILVNEADDRPFSKSPIITAIDGVAKTITVDIKAGRTQSGWDIPCFIRKD